jgi:hypothetical protein
LKAQKWLEGSREAIVVPRRRKNDQAGEVCSFGSAHAQAQEGSWCGNARPEAIYVAQELLAVDGYNFRLYKHGPYSFDLSDELAAMRADDAVRLCPQHILWT